MIFNISETVSGGGGLEYEEGIFTPSENVEHPEIPFTNSHSEAPAFIAMKVIDSVGSTMNTNVDFFFIDYYKLFGGALMIKSNALHYAIVLYHRKSSATAVSGATITSSNLVHSSDGTEDTSGYPRFYAKETAFYPFTMTGRYFEAGLPYKWFAVWR